MKALLFLSFAAVSFAALFTWGAGSSCSANVAGCKSCYTQYTQSECSAYSSKCTWSGGKCSGDDKQYCCNSSGTCKEDSIMNWWTACGSGSQCDSEDTFPCHALPNENTRNALSDLKASCGIFSSVTLSASDMTNTKTHWSSSVLNNLGMQYSMDRATTPTSTILFTSLTISGARCTSLPSSLAKMTTLTSVVITNPSVAVNIGNYLNNLPSSVTSLTVSGTNFGGALTDMKTFVNKASSSLTLSITGTSVTGNLFTELQNLRSVDVSNNKLDGILTTSMFTKPFTLKVSDNYLRGSLSSTLGNSCTNFNNNCIAAVSSCTLTRRNIGSGCSCDYYTGAESACKTFFSTEKCDWNESSLTCLPFTTCASSTTAGECAANPADKCHWCGLECMDKTSSCPACSSYNSSKCTSGLHTDGTACMECKARSYFVRCMPANEQSSCMGCGEYNGNAFLCGVAQCLLCTTGSVCIDASDDKPCPTCGGNDVNSCDSSLCTWCAKSTTCVVKGETCQRTCVQEDSSTCSYPLVDNGISYSGECTYCGASCVKKGFNCPDCSSYTSDCTNMNTPDSTGTCTNCGNDKCRNSLSVCPVCSSSSLSSKATCTAASDPLSEEANKQTCLWCGVGGGGCKSSHDVCPACDILSKSQCADTDGNCHYCDGQQQCNPTAVGCAFPTQYTIVAEIIDRLKDKSVLPDNYADFANDKSLFCTGLNAKKNYETDDSNLIVTCSDDFTEFDTVVFRNVKFSGDSWWTLLSGLSARVLVVSETGIKAFFNETLAAIDYTRLEVLDASHNEISGTVEDGSMMPKQKLDVSYNSLSGTLPPSMVVVPNLVIESNFFSGYVGNCDLYKMNCFSDDCTLSTLNPKCDCSSFETAELTCTAITFCSFVERNETVNGVDTVVTECNNKELVKEESEFPTTMVIIIVVVVFVVIVIIAIVAVVLTRRKKAFSSSGSFASTANETEFDSKTGANVTF